MYENAYLWPVRDRSFLSALPLSFLLFFCGLFVMLLVKASGLQNEVEATSPIVVELDAGLAEDGLNDIMGRIRDQSGIIEGSITYIGREEALGMMRESLPEMKGWKMDNPFRDVITFRLESELYTDERLVELRDQLGEFPGVSSVFYQDSISSETEELLSRIGLFAIIINVLLLLVALFLMQDFIRSSINGEKNKIRIMELVGGTKQFIRAPYLARAFKLGMVSVAMAAIFLILLVIYLNNAWLATFKIAFDELLFSLVSITVLGLIVAVVGTYIIVNIYLRQIYQRA